MNRPAGSVITEEISQFSKDAGRWWDEAGPFAPLHRMGPARLSYIRAQICAHFGRDEKALKPFEKLSVLDIGCGGGLICEPLARLGAQVTGADADAKAIEVARTHAEQSGLKIDYHNKAAEDLSETYDVVLALEIIEHVRDPQAFVESCARLLKPGGIVIFSTLNRTPKSFALGIVAAEYILRWVPTGTHDWKKFIRPSELARHARHAGLNTGNISGIVFKPFSGDFAISKTDMGVNYFLSATRHKA
jgi:2-polyprenyl-6-hydroxyphenyl methylase/3-demethylubiquinone-9 3-methyltransferase